MVAEMVDAVIGIDTHRDSHEVEIADPRGTPIGTMRTGNDSAGFTQLLAAIAEVAPGPVPSSRRDCGHLNLAECYRKLGDLNRAREHV